jgi:small-conductance mechanosensitive channel
MLPHIQIIFESLLYIFLGLAAGIILRYFVGKTLLGWAEKTETDLDDKIALLLKKHILWLCFVLGIWFGIRNTEQIHIGWVLKIEAALFVLLIIGLVLLFGKVLTHSYELLSVRHPELVQTNSLMKGIIFSMVGLSGLMVILNRFGISVAPAIAAVGVGGIAIALALQDTLGNLFAGMYILLAKRIRIDDFIRLEAGQEGNVHDITWRHTTIRQPNNNLIIVPNIKMAQAIIVNFTVLNPETTAAIPISVRYGTDIDKVERVVRELVDTVQTTTPGMNTEFVPLFRLNPGFGPSSLDFTLTVGITRYDLTAEVTDAIRRALLKRFTDEGIEFPASRMEVMMMHAPRKEATEDAS